MIFQQAISSSWRLQAPIHSSCRYSCSVPAAGSGLQIWMRLLTVLCNLPEQTVKPGICNRKSIASRNSCKHGHFLDFSSHRRNCYAFKEKSCGNIHNADLAVPVFIGLSTFITISTAKSGLKAGILTTACFLLNFIKKKI